MSLAFLYAGQGSQHPGMGADLYEAHPAFRAVLDAAGVDFDLKTTMFTDPDGVLNLTEYTQPCMVAFAAGMTALLAERGIVPDYAAGLSLGEYSALQCAGVFTAPQAISLAAFRGKAMAAAAPICAYLKNPVVLRLSMLRHVQETSLQDKYPLKNPSNTENTRP